MFHSATIRLTGLYVAILVVICLFFSLNLYQASSRELDTSLGRQMMFFQNNPRFQDILGDDYQTARQSQLETGRHHLIVELFDIDLLIVILGGVGSYFLARYTLRPIAAAHDAQVRFTADASHELKTPIATMQAEIEVALRDKKLTKDQATELLKSNLEELGRLSGLAQGLLQLTRPDAAPTTTAVTLTNIVREAVSRVEKLAAHKKIAITWSGVEPLSIKGDEPSLVTLLVTLLDNAIKYSDPGQPVEVTGQALNHQAVIKVTDHGRGIKATDLPHIFERFYRAETGRSKTKVEGYGLGLSIAQTIADRHHGQIEAASSLGHGSVFTVKLPL